MRITMLDLLSILVQVPASVTQLSQVWNSTSQRLFGRIAIMTDKFHS